MTALWSLPSSFHLSSSFSHFCCIIDTKEKLFLLSFHWASAVALTHPAESKRDLSFPFLYYSCSPWSVFFSHKVKLRRPHNLAPGKLPMAGLKLSTQFAKSFLYSYSYWLTDSQRASISKGQYIFCFNLSSRYQRLIDMVVLSGSSPVLVSEL